MICTFAVGLGAVQYSVSSSDDMSKADLPPVFDPRVDFINSAVPEIPTDSIDPSFSGWYDMEKYDAKMGEVSMILIDRFADYETGDKNKLIDSGGVFTTFEDYGDQGFVEASWSKIDLPRVTFKTKKIKGFDYRFEGIFFKNKVSGEEGEKVLRGTLKKYRNGKKLAEVSGDFAYYEPHCWH